MMRIAYLTNQYPKVSHSFIRREILEMERQGVEVVRFAFRGWDAEVVDPEDEAEKTRTRYTLREGMGALLKDLARQAIATPGPFWRALKAALALSRNSLRPWPYHLVYLAHACRIRRWLDEHPVDHLHAHFGTNPAEVALLLKHLGGPGYSFTIHGMDEADNAPKLGFDRKVAGARFVATISAYTRSQLMRHVEPDLWERLRVVHCGLDPQTFEGVQPADPAVGRRFLCIGRLSPEKGHLILLPAFAELLKQHPEARLVLAGDGDMRPQIEARIAELGLGDAVRITGWISADQVLDELRACHILVQPSFIEGLPVVIMEAMAQHRAVLSTYVAGIPELVQDGITGRLVPAGDIPALAEAMEALTRAPAEELDQMGALGQERVRERHSISTEVAKLRALFEGSAE